MEDNLGALLTLQYVITIPLAIYALGFMPRRGTLSQYWENARRNSAVFGLLPCGPAAILISAIGVGLYYLRVRMITAKEESLTASWTTSPTKSSGNPFSNPSGKLPARESTNPFGPSSPGSGNSGTNSANPWFNNSNRAGRPDEQGQSNPFN